MNTKDFLLLEGFKLYLSKPYDVVRFGNLLKTISSSAAKEDPLEGFENSIKNIKRKNSSGDLTLGIKQEL